MKIQLSCIMESMIHMFGTNSVYHLRHQMDIASTKHDVISMLLAEYTYTKHISLQRPYSVDLWMLIYMYNLYHLVKIFSTAKEMSTKFCRWLTVLFSQMHIFPLFQWEWTMYLSDEYFFANEICINCWNFRRRVSKHKTTQSHTLILLS